MVRSVAKCVYIKGKTVSCGECGCREVTKLEWFVGKANWDVVRMEKCPFLPVHVCLSHFFSHLQ